MTLTPAACRRKAARGQAFLLAVVAFRKGRPRPGKPAAWLLDQAALRAALAEDEGEGKERMAGALRWAKAAGLAVLAVGRRKPRPIRPRAPATSKASVAGSGTTVSSSSLFETESVAGRPSIEPLTLLPRPVIDSALTSV